MQPLFGQKDGFEQTWDGRQTAIFFFFFLQTEVEKKLMLKHKNMEEKKYVIFAFQNIF